MIDFFLSRSISTNNKLSPSYLFAAISGFESCCISRASNNNNQVAWYIITQNMIRDAGAKADDIDGFTDFIRSIKGVEIACMIQEINSNTFRINFRSSGNYIINDIAKSMGGGGHYYAAGARVEGTNINDLETMLVEKLNNKIESGN